MWYHRISTQSLFSSRRHTALVYSCGLQQEFFTLNSSEQNGIVERVIQTLKEQRMRGHQFETIQHASRVFYRIDSVS